MSPTPKITAVEAAPIPVATAEPVIEPEPIITAQVPAMTGTTLALLGPSSNTDSLSRGLGDGDGAGPKNGPGNGTGDRPGFGLTTYLTRHGAKARVKQVAASGGIADTILDQVAEEKADLLVMGGYGHSRVREMMFGGVTRSILESTACPILVSH